MWRRTGKRTSAPTQDLPPPDALRAMAGTAADADVARALRALADALEAARPRDTGGGGERQAYDGAGDGGDGGGDD